MTKLLVCENKDCRIDFHPKSKTRRFCSLSCSAHHHRKTLPSPVKYIICEVCGKTLCVPAHSWQKYCAKSPCSRAVRRLKWRIRYAIVREQRCNARSDVIMADPQ